MSEQSLDGQVDPVAEFGRMVDECIQIDKAFLDGSLDAWLERKRQSELDRFLADYERPVADPG